jgi:hypothetical protein
MNLSIEQKNKMKEKLIQFCEELGEIIKGKNIDLDIPLASNYNTYGGLVLKIHNAYFGFTTNKTRFITLYSVSHREDSDDIYCRWKYQNNGISYYAPFVLDILMNKDKILRLVKEKIQYNDNLLDSILND